MHESAIITQRAKEVVSDSLGLVDFAIRLVSSVINLPDGQVKFFEEFKLQKYCQINLLIKTFLGLLEMMFGLVNVSFSLPEWQAVKMTFFAPCHHTNRNLSKCKLCRYVCAILRTKQDGLNSHPPDKGFYCLDPGRLPGLDQ